MSQSNESIANRLEIRYEGIRAFLKTTIKLILRFFIQEIPRLSKIGEFSSLILLVTTKKLTLT